MIEERLQQIVEAEKRAQAAEDAALKEVAALQEEQKAAQEMAELQVREDVAARRQELEAMREERGQSDFIALEKDYTEKKKAAEVTAQANREELIDWLWGEVIRKYGRDANAKVVAGDNA